MTAAVEGILALAEEGVAAAIRAGADEAEAYASRTRTQAVTLQQNDVKGASTDDETTLGIRVFRGGAMGFATANDPGDADAIAREAVAIARVSPSDPHNGLPDPMPLQSWELTPDAVLEALPLDRLAEIAAAFLDRARTRDARISVDSGAVSVDAVTRGIVSSRGVRAIENHVTGSGSLFGMAVDGGVVGSFDYDGDAVRQAAAFEPSLLAAADRFVTKATAALHAKPGESFRGPVILSPEVVSEFLLGNLLAVLSAKAVRTGKSPLKGRIGEAVAARAFTLVDDAGDPARVGTTGFDREGMPSTRRVLVRDGVLQSFLHDSYEARVGGGSPGNARGGAAGPPSIGVAAPTVSAGAMTFASLCAEPKRAVLVSRFSGSSNPITGEFSGVVKGGFLLTRGERRPIREVQIAGNFYDALRAISGISIESRLLDGNVVVPALRIEDVSITAG